MAAPRITRQQALKGERCRNARLPGTADCVQDIPAGQFYCRIEYDPKAERYSTWLLMTEVLCHECALKQYATYRRIIAKLQPGQLAYMLAAVGNQKT